MSVATIRPDAPHPLGWVLTRLVAGDQLGNAPELEHDLSKLYDVSARAIVEGNGVVFRAEAIEGDGGWIHRVAKGKRLTNPDGSTKRWVFDSSSTIWLPPGGPREPVNAAIGPVKASALRIAAWTGGVVVAIGIGIAALRAAMKRRTKR